MRFFLGAHHPGWLWDERMADTPLFVSRRRLTSYKKFKPAQTDWILDSGGFSELNDHGRWTLTAPEYVREVLRYRAIGRMQAAAICDWMCEPHMLQKTGLTIAEHQRRTIASYRDLRDLAPELPWFPVLQGWHQDDYLRHLGDYARAGFDLTTLPLVGVGTVCRRQHTDEAEGILRTLAGEGLRLHAFGFKVQGLASCADVLTSADSMAWSYRGRRMGHTDGRAWCGSEDHQNCANCPLWALEWYRQVTAQLARQEAAPRQLSLWGAAA